MSMRIIYKNEKAFILFRFTDKKVCLLVNAKNAINVAFSFISVTEKHVIGHIVYYRNILGLIDDFIMNWYNISVCAIYVK